MNTESVKVAEMDTHMYVHHQKQIWLVWLELRAEFKALIDACQPWQGTGTYPCLQNLLARMPEYDRANVSAVWTDLLNRGVLPV